MTEASETPDGWEFVTLADVTNPSRDKAEPSTFKNTQYIGLEHIESGTNRIIGTGDVSSVKSTKTVFCAGDVLYGKLRPYLNKVCRPDFDGVFSTDILVFPQTSFLDNGYLLHFLSSRATTDYAMQHTSGINLPRVNARTLGAIPFPLAPLTEQQRIVARIELSQKRSRKAQKVLAELEQLLKQFRMSLLAAAFRGELTTQWRMQNPNVETATDLIERTLLERRQRWEEKELAKYETKGIQPPKHWQHRYKAPEKVEDSELGGLPDGWCWCRLGNLIESIDAGKSPSALSRPATSSEQGVLKVSAVTWTEFDPHENKALKDSDEIGDTPTPQKGDLLISRANTVELVGAVVLVKADYPNLMLSDKTLRLNPVSTDVQSEYILFGLRSPSVRRWFEANATGSSDSMRNLSQSKILNAPIALAPIEEQHRIVELLIKSEQQCTVIESRLKSLEADLSHLNDSILTKAFQGELVPQASGDEPAAELLRRIRDERAMSKKKRPEKKVRQKSPESKEASRSSLVEHLLAASKSIAPERLFEVSGFDEQSVDAFYGELREAIDSGLIVEVRPNDTDVTLEVKSP